MHLITCVESGCCLRKMRAHECYSVWSWHVQSARLGLPVIYGYLAHLLLLWLQLGALWCGLETTMLIMTRVSSCT